MTWRNQQIEFALLAVALYLISGSFVNYWPLGLLQAGLVLLMPVLLQQERTTSALPLGLGLAMLSLVLGVALVLLEKQLIWSWRCAAYLLIHGLWVLVFWHIARGVQMALSMCLSVASFLLAICLLNGWSIADSQRFIALLEGLLFLLALFVYGREVLLPRRMWLWGVGVTVAFSLSNVMAIRDEVGLADWWRVVQIIAHFLLALVLWVWLRREVNALVWLAAAVGLAVVVYAVVLLAAWFSMDDPARFDWFSSPPLFAHIRHVGYFLCVGVVAGGWAVLVAPSPWKWLAWAIYVLALAMLLWSGGRGAFLSALVGGATLLAMAPLRTHGRLWGWLFVGLLLGLLISAQFPVEHRGLGWMSAWGRSSEAESLNRLSSSRLVIWDYLLGFIAQRPLLGWGGEGFRAVWKGISIYQAHNGLLQVLIEWGLLGLLVIGMPLITVTLRGSREYFSREGEAQVRVGFGMALVSALLVFSMVDGILYYGLPLAFLVVGYATLSAGFERRGAE